MADPVLIAYCASPRGSTKRAYWHRIGEAYPHDTGTGLTIVLNVIPLDGRIVLLEPDESDDRRLATLAAAHSKPHSKRMR